MYIGYRKHLWVAVYAPFAFSPHFFLLFSLHPVYSCLCQSLIQLDSTPDTRTPTSLFYLFHNREFCWLPFSPFLILFIAFISEEKFLFILSLLLIYICVSLRHLLLIWQFGTTSLVSCSVGQWWYLSGHDFRNQPIDSPLTCRSGAIWSVLSGLK